MSTSLTSVVVGASETDVPSFTPFPFNLSFEGLVSFFMLLDSFLVMAIVMQTKRRPSLSEVCV